MHISNRWQPLETVRLAVALVQGWSTVCGAAYFRTVMQVNCSNCGGIGPEFWLALGAFIVSLGALWFSKVASDAANQDLAMARQEHREFLTQLQARARFKLRIRVPRADDDGVYRVAAASANITAEIGLKNDGTRAATATLLNVMVPRSVPVRWCGPNGEELPDVAGPAETGECLMDATGKEQPAHFLSFEIPRVGRRPHYVKFFRLSVSAVPPPGEELSIPIKVTADADELPDDEPELSGTLMLRVVHPQA
jgi:hypothetical protein